MIGGGFGEVPVPETDAERLIGGVFGEEERTIGGGVEESEELFVEEPVCVAARECLGGVGDGEFLVGSCV